MNKKPAHELCQHTTGAIMMRRVYVRDHAHGGKFVPCGWMCPDCKQFQRD